MSRKTKFQFRLYTADDTLNSVEALANLTALCKTHLLGRYDIEIVDVFENPEKALADKIRMTPTLLKLWPQPARRIVGTLNQTKLVLMALGLDVPPQ
jgi:circadian clock protein KaiB